MTKALCFHCGEVKFGAICPCPSCGTASTGDMSLDIAFSDHRMDVQTLEEFGEVVRAIEKVEGDPRLKFWAFIEYVSQHHPTILHVELKPEVKADIEQLLEGVVLPEVTLREVERYSSNSEGADED